MSWRASLKEKNKKIRCSDRLNRVPAALGAAGEVTGMTRGGRDRKRGFIDLGSSGRALMPFLISGGFCGTFGI
jgi:hypothetical protein